MEEVDSRFLHLLQPIRDLTKNWEVDVAAQLGEYLEEVEYLYMLVCQALDCISNKKREKLPTSLGPDGRDTDATFTDEQEEFLSLDDIPETSQASVDMRRGQQPAAVNIVPLTPMALVPPEEGEKKDNPLLSRRGEVLASRRDFRMNTSTPHASGAFLLELAGLSPTHPQQEQRLGTATGAAEPDDDDIPEALGNDMEVIPAPSEHIEAQREEPNPWQSLDPFGDSEEKPFRKGRPFLVPHGLDDMVGGKRKRKGPRKLQDFTRWFSAAYLELLYWRQFKERLAAQRKLQSRRELLRELEPELEQEYGADGEGGSDDDFVEHEDMEPEAPEELEEGAQDPPELGYEELVRRNVESRVPFDVHAYRLQLTERCAELGQWHSLASLVAGQPPFEVCRYLLASLQLANDAEVELAQDAGLEQALDTARLRRLTARPAHERFQNLQLPSQRDPDPK
ncbi:Condensin-2 complex subunit H2 [Lonchura striata]|uniref:Condensin-2 complex subunit H2 n=1 Tax=Lonchura striata TaxID=40157 RepID=A0A218UBE9_9PASE|nr:Condensin-2 complex subunit H2 [Lonchura striata domestica]